MKNGEKTPRPDLRPAQTQLRGSARPKIPRSAVYLSWGGEIYGPSSWEEVAAGVRTSWFEEGALYWHEGLDSWRPVSEFPPAAKPSSANDCFRRVLPDELPCAPSPATGTGGKNLAGSGSRRPRGSKPAPRRPGPQGRPVLVGFALLAIILVVGIILLMMMV